MEENLEPDELAYRYAEFYRLFEPSPPNQSTGSILRSEGVLEMNKITISQIAECSFRTTPAPSGAWSVVYPHPLELPHLIPKLFQHIEDWIQYFEINPNPDLMDEFCRSLIPKIVTLYFLKCCLLCIWRLNSLHEDFGSSSPCPTQWQNCKQRYKCLSYTFAQRSKTIIAREDRQQATNS